MKLTVDQREWFSRMQAEWLAELKPASTPLGGHVFDVPPRIPDDAALNAKVFASRAAALKSFKTGGVVAEVGTQAGYFARQILNVIRPETLHLFDLEFETLRTHNLEVAEDHRVQLHLGDSSTRLSETSDQQFDWIYIDGDHEISGVQKDTEVAITKIKDYGFLVFNDYTVWSPMELIDYGVVPVVNGLLASGEWEMIYIALHQLMYCDVAIQRKTNKR